MDGRKFVRFSGLAAIGGGLLWSLFAVMASTKPIGCITVTCSIRPMRETTDLAPLMLSAMVLLLIGFAGLLAFAAREGRFGRGMKSGVVLTSLGAVILAAALAIQAILYAGDFPAMPSFVIPGGILLAAGVLLLGIAIYRLMPAWVGTFLVVSAVALVFGNDQDARVLLYVPFGLAWMAIGWTLLSGSASSTDSGTTNTTSLQ